MTDDESHRAREWADGIPAFNAWAERWVRPYLGRAAGALLMVWLVWQQLWLWLGVVAVAFLAAWLGATPRALHALRALVARAWAALTPARGVSFHWVQPAQDDDHAQARAAFESIIRGLATASRAVDGDGRVERRKWIYAAAEQADGLMIRGDDPYQSIRTRPERASAPRQFGFVGAAVGLGRWRVIAMACLGAIAALLYARGEVLEASRDQARADQARAEERAMAADQHRIAAETDLTEYIEMDRTETRLALEQARISRDFLTEQDARRRRLEQRRAEREQATLIDTPDPVDLSDSLRDLAAPASTPAMPEVPAAAPGGDPAG